MGQQYLSTDPNAGEVVAPTQPQMSAGAAARKQGNERWGEYLAQTLRNIPRDALDQALGAVGLVKTLAGASAELGSDIGNVARETVGLTPYYLKDRPNEDALKAMPGAMLSHFGDYLDPEKRALMVREHPVGLGIDVAAAKGAVGLAGDAVGAGARPVARAVAKAGPVGRFIAKRAANMAGIPGVAVDAAEAVMSPQAKTSPTPPPTQSAATSVRPEPVPDSSILSPRAVSERLAARPASAPAPAAAPVEAAPASPPPARPVSARTTAAADPAVPTPQVRTLPGETLTTPPSARTPGQMSPASIQNDLGLSARRLGVTLDETQFAQAAEAVTAEGLSPAQAVVKVAGQPAPQAPATAPSVPAPSPRLRVTADEATEYARMLAMGKSVEEATQAIVAQRQLKAAVPGTRTPKQARANVAQRNATGRWPEGTP